MLSYYVGTLKRDSMPVHAWHVVGGGVTSLKLVGAVDRELHDAVTVVDLRNGSEGAGSVGLSSVAMLRVAERAQQAGLRVQHLRLEDATRGDDDDLDELQQTISGLIRSGRYVEAEQLLLDHPVPLIITELAVHDRFLHVTLHWSRRGVVSFGGEPTAEVKKRVLSLVNPPSGVFAL
jgi:hypothetical protein